MGESEDVRVDHLVPEVGVHRTLRDELGKHDLGVYRELLRNSHERSSRNTIEVRRFQIQLRDLLAQQLLHTLVGRPPRLSISHVSIVP